MIISKLHVIVYITLYSRFCLSQVTCTSPCISQATSVSTSQSHSPDQGGKVKASQWVKMLDLKTPTKNSQDVTFPELEDSAKKKKKKYTRYITLLLDDLVLLYTLNYSLIWERLGMHYMSMTNYFIYRIKTNTYWIKW